MSKVVCLSLSGEKGPHLDILRNGGFEVGFKPEGADLWREDDLIRTLDGAVASVAGSEPYTRRVIEASPKLRVIARTGVGFDAVDLKACDDHGIVVATTPGVNHHAVAEQTIAMLVAVARGYPALDQGVRVGNWIRRATPRVMGSTLGIVGLGRIGRAVATRGRGLGMNVIAFDPFANKEFADQWQIGLVSLDELLATSDYITLHSPATPETKHMINATTLAKMKSDAVVINTARGSLIDETALVDALQSGRIRGAALDVFEVEPLPVSSPLTKLDNVLLSGHIAGLDRESHAGMFAMAAEVIVELSKGGWPTECVRNLSGVKNWKW